MGCLISVLSEPGDKPPPAAVTISAGMVPLHRMVEAEEASEVAGRSFAGTATQEPEHVFDWVLGNRLAARDDARRQPVMRFITRFGIDAARRSKEGVVLGVRDEGDELRGVVAARRLDGPPKDCCNTCCTLCGHHPIFGWVSLSHSVSRPSAYALS